MSPVIEEIRSERDLRRAFLVIQELRKHLDEDEFVARVRRQACDGYRIAVLTVDGGVVAVAGFRMSESLAWGRYLYVDDLVTTERVRSMRYGAALLDWLENKARKEGCREVHLDSGTQRAKAHAFYARQGYVAPATHFVKKIPR